MYVQRVLYTEMKAECEGAVATYVHVFMHTLWERHPLKPPLKIPVYTIGLELSIHARDL